MKKEQASLLAIALAIASTAGAALEIEPDAVREIEDVDGTTIGLAMRSQGR